MREAAKNLENYRKADHDRTFPIRNQIVSFEIQRNDTKLLL